MPTSIAKLGAALAVAGILALPHRAPKDPAVEWILVEPVEDPAGTELPVMRPIVDEERLERLETWLDNEAARFAKVEYLGEYIAEKEKEVADWNENQRTDLGEMINGRRLTNVGTFRAYVVNYLRAHPMIHDEMTFLVRHLPPTEHGLPIEIYVFSRDQAWVSYEAIQADIFDHILAVVPEFGLRVFQRPSGTDLQGLST